MKTILKHRCFYALFVGFGTRKSMAWDVLSILAPRGTRSFQEPSQNAEASKRFFNGQDTR